MRGPSAQRQRSTSQNAQFSEDTLVGVGVEGLARWLSTLAALEALVVVCHLL